jgi:hypothetical protein
VSSQTTERFRRALAALPEHVQDRARQAYQLFRDNPQHPSLRFKQVHTTRPIYSARVGLGYRALAVRDDAVYIWFWIGTHAEYDRLLKDL